MGRYIERWVDNVDLLLLSRGENVLSKRFASSKNVLRIYSRAGCRKIVSRTWGIKKDLKMIGNVSG